MDILKAFSQWATRPADERFWNLAEAVNATKKIYNQSAQATVRYSDLRVEASGQDLRLVGKTGSTATLTNYAFGQLASRGKAPAGYLRTLPATLAAQNLNHGLKARGQADDASVKLLMYKNGSYLCRAALSEQYQRIWNWELFEKLRLLEGEGWRTPPARPVHGDDPRARPATESDVLKDASGFLSIKVGDMIAPAGIYASDRDCFVFLIDDEHTINDGTDEPLARFVMLWNSEVGNRSLGMMTGAYKHVCGNHIVWGASGVREIRIRHTGNARVSAFRELQANVLEYSNESANEQQAQIKRARSFGIGSTKKEVVDALIAFARKKRLTPLTQVRLEAAYDAAEEHIDWYNTPPTSVWGMVQGLTEVSQREQHTDARYEIDRAAGRVMEMSF